MKSYPLLILAIFVLIGCQNADHNVQNKREQFVIGHTDSIHSEILGEIRKIWIYEPESRRNNGSQIKYPALYLLDGSFLFHSITGIIKELSFSDIVPEMTVIAIENTNRGRDLTPTHTDHDFWTGDSTPDSGGGEQFLDFIESELIPYVENKYNLSGYRTFIGHSLGGLTVIHTIMNRPYLFDNYIAVEPSLWYDDQYIIKSLDTLLNELGYSRKSLFVGVGNTMRPGFDMNNLFSDTTRNTIHLRSLFQFVKRLEEKSGSGLKFGWNYYEEDDHNSAALITAYDGLRFIFPWYRLELPDKYYSEPFAEANKEELFDMITRHYDTISYFYGYEVLPSELKVRDLGLEFLYFWQKPEYAHTLFELNIRNYPDSKEAYVIMGDYYLMLADTIKAIEHLSKALEIGGEAHSQDLMERLDLLNAKN